MKSLKFVSLTKFALGLVFCSSVSFAGVLQDLDSLGGNDVLLERAEVLNPEKKIEVVQDRVVSRRMRSEMNIEYGGVVGGDAYVKTEGLSLAYNLHFSPRWSLGLKGSYYMNRLSDEGKYSIDKAQKVNENLSKQAKSEFDSLGLIPVIDYPKYAGYLLANWYPFYGKLNLHDLGVVQYDIYTLLGGGQIELKSGPTTAITAGGGMGFWLSQHLTSRFEVRYETYEAKRLAGNKERMNLTVLGFSMGYLL